MLSSRFFEFTRRRLHSGLIFPAVFLALTVAAASKLSDSVAEIIQTDTGTTKVVLYGLVSIIGATALTTDVLYQFWKRKEPPPSLPAIQRERLSVIRVSTLEQLKEIQELIVPALFGDATPPREEVYKILSHNPGRTLALFSDDELRYVGFATIWPITDDAAAAMMSGSLLEEALTTEHVLPSSGNASARYAIIPGVGVLNPYSTRGARRGLKLMLNFRNLIVDEYLSETDRCIELLAFAYSEDGKQWCERFQMKVETIVRSHLGARLPLYRRKFCAKDLRIFDELV